MSVYIPIMHAKKHQEEIQKMRQKINNYEETLQMLRSEIEELKREKAAGWLSVVGSMLELF